jgi:hypothetical protein
MMVGELVFPDVMVGIIEASTTLSPSIPRTPQATVSYGGRVILAAHFASADRVKDGGTNVTGGKDQLIISTKVWSRQMLYRLERVLPSGGPLGGLDN